MNEVASSSPALKELSDIDDESPLCNLKKAKEEDENVDEVQFLGSSKVVSRGSATRQSKRKSVRGKDVEMNPASEWEDLSLYDFAEKLSFASVGMCKRLKLASLEEKRLLTENEKLHSINTHNKTHLQKMKDSIAAHRRDLEHLKKDSEGFKIIRDDAERRLYELRKDFVALENQAKADCAKAVTEAVKHYKGSSEFGQELNATMWYVSRYFYTLGATHVAAVNGDLSLLASPEYYLPDASAAVVERCVATWMNGGEVRGVNFIVPAVETSTSASANVIPAPSSS